ncbi:MAG: ABC transporter permease [Eubacteriaceae bacterium]|nr:ABC transporter permease [Eubacteriaceae bacterium]
MEVFFNLSVNVLIQSLIYAVLTYGIYITYKILDFPDLTVDGSFPLGAAVSALLLVNGADPWLTIVAAALSGALAGLFTGIIHVKFKVRDLLAGIITMTALFSLNLQIAGSNLTVDRATPTIFTSGIAMRLFGGLSLSLRKLIISALIAFAIKILLDIFFKTKYGMLLFAVGDNERFVTSLARDKGSVKIMGLVISDALVAISGCLVCQEQRSFSATMGTGQMVFGLAAVIIGSTVFRKMSFVKGTSCALAGSLIYKLCIQIAILLGLPANLLKMVTAVLFLVILIVGQSRTREA